MSLALVENAKNFVKKTAERSTEENILLKALGQNGSLTLTEVEELARIMRMDSGRSAVGILRDLCEGGKGIVIEDKGVFYLNRNIDAHIKRWFVYLLAQERDFRYVPSRGNPDSNPFRNPEAWRKGDASGQQTAEEAHESDPFKT